MLQKTWDEPDSLLLSNGNFLATPSLPSKIPSSEILLIVFSLQTCDTRFRRLYLLPSGFWSVLDINGYATKRDFS